MKGILNIIRQDITTALRDNIIVYLIIAPFLIALGMRMFLPSAEEAELKIAVEENMDKRIIQQLEEYGRVEIYEDREGVIRRVEAVDSVAGVLDDREKVILVFEGNEAPEVIATYKNIIGKITLGRELVVVHHKSVGEKSSLLFDVVTVSMVMLASLFGGVVSGFNTVSERETKAIRAIAVSPISNFKYITARGMIAVIIGGVIAFGTSLIMAGTAINYWHLLVAYLSSFAITIVIFLIMGGFASNQISAIVVIKVLMPIYLFIPLLSLFISERIQYLFYWLPNYWQFQTLSNLYFSAPVKFDFWTSAGLTLITSSILMLIMAKLVSKKFKLR